jgi:hypothetical protein
VNEEAAFTVFASVLAGGIAVWLIALLVHRRAFRPADPSEPQVLSHGELMIEAPAAEIREKTVAALRGGLPGIGSVLLQEADARRISGEITLVGESGGAHRRSPVGQSVRFVVELDPLGSRTSATYRLLGSGGGCLKAASGMFVYLITPAVLATAGYVVPTFIVGSEEPAIRYQVFQTLQIIHFLWPPFLFAGLRNRVAKVVTRSLANVLRNAAF